MQGRPFLSFIVLVGLVSVTTPVHADRYSSPARFGLGLELGAPTGLSGKYFLGGIVAIQGGVGVVESWGYGGTHVHAEALWHPVLLKHTPAVDIPLHVGIGGRFLQHNHGYDRCFNGRNFFDCMGSDSHLGIRVPVGVSFVLRNTPMDFFVEFALTFDVMHVNDDYGYNHDHAGINGALGGRYYF